MRLHTAKVIGSRKKSKAAMNGLNSNEYGRIETGIGLKECQKGTFKSEVLKRDLDKEREREKIHFFKFLYGLGVCRQFAYSA